MENLQNGGRAFPCDSIVERDENGCMHGKEISSGGMTLRDYFAAKALQAMLSNQEWNHWSTEQHAEYAYGVADAMLKARE